GYVPTVVDDGTRGQPCECCPVDLQVYPDGDTVMVFRNNIDNVREIYLLDAPTGGPFTQTAKVSDTRWEISGCPFDGPVLGRTEDTLVATWVDGTLGDNYAFFAHSPDRGHTWSPSAQVFPANDNSMTWPTATAAEDGSIWLSIEEIWHRTLLAHSVDGGATWAEVEDPGEPLFVGELGAGDGRVGLVGITEDGELHYREDFAEIP
ncbi:MAG: sialidase family protein, partial [Myxococcota bacterium]